LRSMRRFGGKKQDCRQLLEALKIRMPCKVFAGTRTGTILLSPCLIVLSSDRSEISRPIEDFDFYLLGDAFEWNPLIF
jgi:hypothetical protein